MLVNIWIAVGVLLLPIIYVFVFRFKNTFSPPDYFRDNEKVCRERYFSCEPCFDMENIKCPVEI